MRWLSPIPTPPIVPNQRTRAAHPMAIANPREPPGP